MIFMIKKNIYGFFFKKFIWLDGEFGDIFWGDWWFRYLILVIVDYCSVILWECVMYVFSIIVFRLIYLRYFICLFFECVVCGDCLFRILIII